ncbi:Peroxidase mlt-7, partial [Nowakowskiella sp. JEL0078]
MKNHIKGLAFVGVCLTGVFVSGQSIRPFLNGTGNNAQNPQWGAANLPFGNFVQLSQLYNSKIPFDPLDDISNNNLELSLGIPSPRLVSDVVARVPGNPEPAAGAYSFNGISDLASYYGEFVAQDLGHVSGTQLANDKADISIPSSESGVANRTIPFIRANFQTSSNVTISSFAAQVRTPINGATSFMDGSMIYGVDSQLLADRRDGYKFKMNSIVLNNGVTISIPPLWSNYNKTTEFSVTNNLTDPNPLFKLGNMGGNTSPYSQVGFHILFIREHNRRADEIKKNNTALSDDVIFENARAWVIALIQQITYYEYIPVILGESLPEYMGYNASVNPTTDAFFSSCAFRYGHSEIGPMIYQATTPNSNEGNYTIEDVLMNTTWVRTYGITPFLIGMTKMTQQDPDIYISRGLRNTLFKGTPIDLFANDIQRARDFGLPSYAHVRKLYGLPVPTAFTDITSNTTVSSNIQSVYKNINLVDALVGGLAESRSATSNLGTLFKAAITNQFVAVRAGDRFWFENKGVLPDDMLAQVKAQTMRDLIALHALDELSKLPDGLLKKDVWHSTDTGSMSGSVPDGFVSVIKNDIFLISSKVSGSSVSINVQCYSNGGWCGFGFGGMMSEAEFIIARPALTNGAINVTVAEYKTQGYQARPQPRTDGSKSVSIDSSNYNKNSKILTFQFTRASSVNNFQTLQFSNQDILFACAPFISTYSDSSAAATDWFVQHSLNRFQATVDFSTGASVVADQMTLPMKLHGILMMISFLLLFPLGIYLKRYYIGSQFVFVHIGIQITSVVIMLGGLVVIFLYGSWTIDTPLWFAHLILGFLLLLSVITVAIIGSIIKWAKNSSFKIRVVLKNMHYWIARVVIVLGFVQTFIGIYKYYPINHFSMTVTYFGWWIGFAVAFLIWITMFIVGELVKKGGIKFKNSSETVEMSPQYGKPVNQPEVTRNSYDMRSGYKIKSPQSDKMTNLTLQEIPHALSTYSSRSPLTDISVGPVSAGPVSPTSISAQNQRQIELNVRKFTWKSLGEAIANGEYLVVGSGRFVY